jgi:hypothetical protein
VNDLRDREPEDELKRYWQESTPDAPGTRNPALVRELSSRVTHFDRKIFWRNFREYAAGLVVLIWSGFMAFRGNRPSIGMALGVSFVMAYLWWQHRKLRQPDPSTNVLVYEKALLERFDNQIRLLSRVRYWYLLPLYIPIIWMTVEWLPRHGWGAIFNLAIVTAAFVFIGWLNEKMAVGQLKEARAKVSAMMKEQEGDGNESAVL